MPALQNSVLRNTYMILSDCDNREIYPPNMRVHLYINHISNSNPLFWLSQFFTVSFTYLITFWNISCFIINLNSIYFWDQFNDDQYIND